MGIKIGIDPSGTGTTAIVVYEDNKIIEKLEFKHRNWMYHFYNIMVFLNNYPSIYQILIEDCIYAQNISGSKDRDNLLRLLGVTEWYFTEELSSSIDVSTISPRHTKSVVKNMENLSKYNNGCIQEFSKDENLTYEYGKGWKYNNEKISNHLRDAIIIANYES